MSPRRTRERKIELARKALVRLGLALLACIVAWYLVRDHLPAHFDGPPLPATATPEQVAERFYLAQAAGGGDALEAVVWHRPGRDSSWWDPSLLRLKDLKVSPSWEASNPYGPTFSEARMLSVTYERVHENEIGEPPGEDGRFVLLGRDAASGRWLVISVGTGP